MGGSVLCFSLLLLLFIYLFLIIVVVGLLLFFWAGKVRAKSTPLFPLDIMLRIVTIHNFGKTNKNSLLMYSVKWLIERWPPD